MADKVGEGGGEGGGAAPADAVGGPQVEELKAAGNKQFASGDHAAAVASFTQALQLAPDNHILYSNRSVRRQRRGGAGRCGGRWGLTTAHTGRSGCVCVAQGLYQGARGR
jgi:hypothetical protein